MPRFIPEIWPMTLPSMSFSIHYSLVFPWMKALLSRIHRQFDAPASLIVNKASEHVLLVTPVSDEVL
jgi:hypothetical protein